MSFVNDLCARCVSRSVGVQDVTIFLTSKAVIPAGAGPFLSIRETGGTSPLRIHNPGGDYKRPSAQFVARGNKYDDVFALARAAYNAVNVRNTTINGSYYQEISPVHEPFDLGLDGTGRVMIAFNVNAIQG